MGSDSYHAAGQKRFDIFNIPGIDRSEHLRKFTYPMSLQLLEYPLIVQMFDIICEPVIIDRQESHER